MATMVCQDKSDFMSSNFALAFSPLLSAEVEEEDLAVRRADCLLMVLIVTQ